MVIHGDKLRWLLWLRWKLLLRTFTRGSGRASSIISTVLLTVVMVVAGGSFAVATFFAYRFAPAPINTEALVLVLSGIFLLWITTPLMQVSTNEGLDVTKLTLFPLTRGELMISLLLSTLLDVSTLFLVLLLGAVVAGWSFSVPVGLVALLTVLVFYVQVLGISQLVIALLSGMMQNRRLRDLSVILIILVSASGYLCQFLFRGTGFIGDLRAGVFETYLQWIPPGMAARAIQQAAQGNWGTSFTWLIALAVVTVLVLYLWQRVVERALASPEIGGIQRARRQRVESARAASVPATAESPARIAVERIIAPQALAVATKDLKYYRRDPQYLRLTVLPLLYVVVLVTSTVLGGGNAGYDFSSADTSGHIFNSFRLLVAPAFVLLSLFSLAYNTLGFDRQSLTTLFLFPVKPRYILLGKNLVIFLLGIIELVIVVLLIAFISRAWLFALPAFTLGLAGIMIVLACGNVTSVFFPQRVRFGQRGFQSNNNISAQEGCLRVIMSFTALAVSAVTLIPVLAAMLLPVIFHATWFWVISIPLSLAYGAFIYYGVTSLVAARMLYRLPEILEVVARE